MALYGALRACMRKAPKKPAQCGRARKNPAPGGVLSVYNIGIKASMIKRPSAAKLFSVMGAPPPLSLAPGFHAAWQDHGAEKRDAGRAIRDAWRRHEITRAPP